MDSAILACRRKFDLVAPFACLAVIAVAAMAACTGAGLPGSKDSASFSTAGTRPVLLNVQCVVDGRPREAFRTTSLVFFRLATFETFGEFSPVLQSGLSGESSREGWTCFHLAPGSHYLRVYGPVAGPQYPPRPGQPRVSVWRVVVPDGTAPLYVGSLLLKGRTVSGIFPLFKSVEPLDSGYATLRAGHEAAETVAAREFPGSGAMQAHLLQPWKPGDPMIFRTPRSR
jgi:hypothetical protein